MIDKIPDFLPFNLITPFTAFSLEDVVADNCSSCAFILGQWCDVPLGLNGLDMK